MTKGDKGREDWALQNRKKQIVCTGSLIELKEAKRKKEFINTTLTLNPRRIRG